jgi:hypothetical protein
MRTPNLAAYLSGVSLCVLLAVGGPALAAPFENPIETDRPDITETSTVVGKGRFQIETAVLGEYLDQGGIDERGFFTPTLLRWGFNDRWEMRLETDGFSHARLDPRRGRSFSTSGYSPLAPGLKYHFQDPREGSNRPSLGAIFHLNVPSGSGAFRAEKLTGDLKIAADWDLAPKWALGVNAGLLLDEDDAGEAFWSGLLTAAVARDLTDRLRTFIELAVQQPESSRGGRGGLILDGGFAYLLDADTQLDLALGTGLTGRTTPDFFWTVGFSKRF